MALVVMGTCEEIVAAGCVPKFLKAAVELKVVENLANAGPGAKLSAAELVSKIPMHANNPNAEATLDRILRILASYSILSSDKKGPDGKRRYGLTPVCQQLIPDENGASFAATLFISESIPQARCWQNLKDAVLEGSVPFEKANGASVYEVFNKEAKTSRLFADAMHGMSVKIMGTVLDGYRGFEGLKQVVDVGGGAGTALTMLASKYPHIKGVKHVGGDMFDSVPSGDAIILKWILHNWDDEHWVKHAGGDMFESVPSGDAIILKWILHNWDDEHCVKVLKNCCKALPDTGKVIVIEYILDDGEDTNKSGPCYAITFEVWMIANFDGGKERSLGEYEALAKRGGFCDMKAFPMSNGLAAIEFYKTPQ
ncbi:hypothetical protein ACLOJK_009569 [Asimina triloba]